MPGDSPWCALGYPRQNQPYAVLYRIEDAKRPETRARRIARFVAMLSRHEKVHR